MALTKKQLQKIERLIRQRFLKFVYEATGPAALSEVELRELKDAGLIRESVRHLTGDAYTLGKIAALMDRTRAESLTFEEAMRAAKKMLPMTGVEKKAIEYASSHAGEYIKGIADDLLKEVKTASARASGAALRAVRTEVAEAIAERKTTKELKTALFDAIDNRYRDWQRIASTEMQDAIQNGIYAEIRENHGADQLVYKRPSGDACKHCRRLYLSGDGTPKVFKLSSLDASNVGRKASAWRATVGPVHPWCQCQLLIVPEGFDFVKKRVAKVIFTSGGKEFKPGQILTETEYDSLSPTNQSKTGFDAVLSYTGETARPSLRKSEDSEALSENGDECVCQY